MQPASDADVLTARLLTRIAAIFIRLGLDSPRTERLLRKAFVDAAKQRIHAGDRRVTQTMLAAMTGLSRLEVRTILRGRSTKSKLNETRVDRILSGWNNDPQFLDSRGKPKSLAIQGSGTTFDQLVRKYGRDVTSRTIREELISRGIAVQLSKNMLTLLPGDQFPTETLAAFADLRFLASHLAAINFQFGRRTYVLRQGSVLAEDKKRVAVARKIAVDRLETVLSSLAEMSTDARSRKQRKGKAHRLFITTVVATEVEEKSR